MPFSAKHHVIPTDPRRTPATAGPKTRVALNTDEFSAIAFIKSSFPTISTRNDWRVGMSNALTIPKNAASPMTLCTVTRPVPTRAASPNACSMRRVCVMITTRRLSVRSATTPA